MAMTRNELLDAIRAAASSEFSEILADESSIDYTFSERFMKRMEKLFRNQKKVYWRYVNTAAKRVAVVFVAAAVLFATACSIKPIREPIMRFITEVYETFTAYFFEGDTTEDVIEKEYTLDPTPEGFAVTDVIRDDNLITTRCESESGDTIIIMQGKTEESEFVIDTEQEGTYKEVIDGVEVMIYDYETKLQAMYIKDSYYFQIACTGDIDIELLKQVIHNLK